MKQTSCLLNEILICNDYSAELMDWQEIQQKNNIYINRPKKLDIRSPRW